MTNLTRMQTSVMRHVTGGLTNKQIAEKEKILPSTVKYHIREAVKRLGATNRIHAAIMFGHLEQELIVVNDADRFASASDADIELAICDALDVAERGGIWF
jgi:DNA-binding CsgD family transcriptional regulator